MLYSSLLLPVLFSAADAQLNTLAKAAGLKYFGTATDNSALSDTAYLTALSNTSDFGQITPANSQKWDAIEPSQGTFTFTNGDKITALAAQNTQLLRCHNTVWYAQLPSWVTGGTWTNATLQAVMKTHITTEMTHYKGQCYAWDVVNEALNDDAGATFRNDVFYKAMGEDYIRIAFETAAAADPDAKLYYNDYSIESAGAKSTAALNIVKSLQASGTRIDGVGFQAHFIVGSSPSKAALISNLEKFTALGVEVAFTELDIRMTLPSSTALLTQQSTDYENTVSACLEVADCVGITVWDFDDKYSWVPSTFSGSGAACLFDENLNRKPAYYGVVAALSSAKQSADTASMTTAAFSSGMTTSFVALSTTAAAVEASGDSANEDDCDA